MVEAAERGEPQFVTKRGAKAVVVLAHAEYERLAKLDVKPARTFAQHILDFPNLPAGMDDIFDFDRRPEIPMRDAEFEE